VNRFAAELLVREALTNAVVHGCRKDPGKRVRCFLRVKGRAMLIAIADDGDGFDWHAALRREHDFPACSGRGIHILQAYADRIRYNDKGNTVTIIKRYK
jgi:anti-sigma regulatory factor (Ser/Thr protein kinase)